MCGITGLICPVSLPNETLEEACRQMTDALRHRGPDDSGVWVDSGQGVALGHRRLSILDLSPAGHQPMLSACGRYVIVYNGEVYNFKAIRKELEAHLSCPRFASNSDTEVMLAAISLLGLRRALDKFIGMFAFALWDRKDCELTLVRDRVGVKPLYYGWAGNNFVFASELKAIRTLRAFNGDVNRHALSLYLRWNYIPGPHSIYGGIFKLPPGHVLRLKVGELPSPSYDPMPTDPYWSAEEVWQFGAEHPWTGTEDEALEELEALLQDVIRLRMVADVPVGLFLSGGIDSSTLAAFMQSATSTPVKTFTIGFTEPYFSEAPYARRVAEYLHTDHTEIEIDSDQIATYIPDMPHVYDEPFSDTSQIPTLLISKLTREKVTVSLSGEGGDELFLGYDRYFASHLLWTSLRRCHPFLRPIAVRLLRSVPRRVIDAFCFPFTRIIRQFGIQTRGLGDRLHRHADFLTAQTLGELYQGVMRVAPNGHEYVIGSNACEPLFSRETALADGFDDYQIMSYLDLVSYLPDDIMVKIDRASMSVSLEAREPFLDHRLIQFLARIPTSMKIREQTGKVLLRRIMETRIPKEWLERPKWGFGLPVAQLLRGPLRDWAESLLEENRLRSGGFLDPRAIRSAWKAHLTGQDLGYFLWGVLMFEGWLDNQ